MSNPLLLGMDSLLYFSGEQKDHLIACRVVSHDVLNQFCFSILVKKTGNFIREVLYFVLLFLFKKKCTASLKNGIFSYAKIKAQISAFVFATRIVQFLLFLNPKVLFMLLACFFDCTCRFCVRPGRTPRSPVFLRRSSNVNIKHYYLEKRYSVQYFCHTHQENMSV